MTDGTPSQEEEIALLTAEVNRLDAANNRLSQMVTGTVNRLEEAKRELMAQAWSEGFDAGLVSAASHSESWPSNPYRTPPEPMGAMA